MSNTYRTIHAAITEGFWCYEDGPPVMTGELREQVGQIVAAACEKIAPAPQVIRTADDIEALDPDSWLVLGDGTQITAVMLRMYIHHHGSGRFLPAVVVATGSHVRACREALEGETT